MDLITYNYLCNIKNRSKHSCMDVCPHTPKCAYQLGAYFCRLSYEDASMLLTYNSLNKLYPSYVLQFDIKNNTTL